MQTGNRWEGNANPRDLTRSRQQQLLREHEARKRAQDNPVDVAAIRKEAYAAAFEPAFQAGAEWAFGVLREAGVDVDAVLALDDEPGDDAADA
jgi:hypothetical protein